MPSLTQAVIGFAAFLVAWGVIWKTAIKPAWVKGVRPAWLRVKTVHELIERELQPNGGGSMKDQITKAAAMASTAAERATHAAGMSQRLADEVAEIRSAQATTFGVLDHMIERRAEDAESLLEMKVAIGELADLKSVIVAIASDEDPPIGPPHHGRRHDDPKETL